MSDMEYVQRGKHLEWELFSILKMLPLPQAAQSVVGNSFVLNAIQSSGAEAMHGLSWLKKEQTVYLWQRIFPELINIRAEALIMWAGILR